MPRTTERAEIIAALGLEPEGRSRSDRYNMTLGELRQKLATQGARGKSPSVAKSDRISESDVDAAFRVIKADYYQDVRDIGDDLKERIKSGEITDSDELQERLGEDVDGSARVIYTIQNKLGLIASDNEDAYVEEFGEVPMEGDNINWAAMMAVAMQRDVTEYLGDVDDLFSDDDEDED